MRYPEAGGSSSFARHAFNELVSFGAAWAQMLNYIITIAISAFFVPHYLSIFWPSLRDNPWDIVVGAVVIVALVLLNIVGIQESARINILLALVDFATQLLLVVIGFVLIFSPTILKENVHWGVAPTWNQFFLAIPVAMIAYTGIETVSNLAEEARDPPRSIPASIRFVALAVFAIYFTLPAIALSALPVRLVDGEYQTLLGLPPEEGGFANDPVLGLVENLGISGTALDVLKVYVGILAATILFIATNAGVIGASRITYAMSRLPAAARALPPAAPALQDAVAVAGRLRRPRPDRRPHPRAARLPRDDVLVRRDALVHGRARVDRGAALPAPGRGARLPRAAESPGARGRLAALRDLRRDRHRARVADRGRADALDALRRPRLARPRLHRLLLLPPQGRAGAAARDGAGAGADPRPLARAPLPHHPRAGRAQRRVGGGARRRRASCVRAAGDDRDRPRPRGAAEPPARRRAPRGGGTGLSSSSRRPAPSSTPTACAR